jgi:signal transduction histidine kinase
MSAIRRWASDPRQLVDALVVVVVAVLSVVDVAASSADLLPGQRAAGPLAYALVIAGAIALGWRRRAPILVLAFVTAAIGTYWLLDYGAYLSVLGLTALYAVAAHEEHRRRAWWAMGITCVLLMVVASVSLLAQDDGYKYLPALSMAAFLAAAVAAGVLIRNRERLFADTERRAAEAEADRLAEAERAVRRERSRIAREMHDVVAHGMSVVAVQAAAGRQIVRLDPDKAAGVFATIEGVSRDSLAELRRMLGVLRDTGDHEASLSPQPGISDLPAAVAQSSAAGVSTELLVEGDQRPVEAGVGLAAYRIVQEALTNVRKHAGASATATVRLVYERDRLVVEVVDDGRGAASALSGAGAGHGLLGMRERVEIYGGELTSGPRPGGGFRVRAVLPIASPAAEPAVNVEPTARPTATSGTQHAQGEGR